MPTTMRLTSTTLAQRVLSRVRRVLSRKTARPRSRTLPVRAVLARSESSGRTGPRGPARRAGRPLSVPPAALRTGRAALRRIPTRRDACSGRVALGRLFARPVAHPQVAAAVAEQRVDLPIVDDGREDLAHEQDVVAGRMTLPDLAPDHGHASFDSRRRDLGLRAHPDLEGRELVGSLRRVACRDRDVL